MKKKRWCWADGKSPCGLMYYRKFLPHIHLPRYLPKIEFLNEDRIIPDCDIYWFNWVIQSGFSEIRKDQARGARYISGWDDHPWELMPWCLSDSKLEKACKDFMGLPKDEWISVSDGCAVTTPFLAEIIRSRHPDKPIGVVPNLADLSRWALQKCEPSVSIKIAYGGSRSHAGELDFIRPVFSELKRLYGDRIRLSLWGGFDFPPELQGQLFHRDWFRSAPEYFKALSQYRPDIFLCPLIPSEFNSCRSPIKWMEGSLAGASCVLSDHLPYSGVVEEGVTGKVVPQHSVECWVEMVSHLIDHPHKIVELNTEARRRVKSDHSWQSEKARQPWIDWANHVSK